MTRQEARATQRLLIAVAQASAEDGEIARGHDCLCRGLHAAQAAVARGDPWAVELVVSYLEALDDYVARYGLRLA
jgi:hypothetical protein